MIPAGLESARDTAQDKRSVRNEVTLVTAIQSTNKRPNEEAPLYSANPVVC